MPPRSAALALLFLTGCALWGAPEWVQKGYAICGPIPCRGVISGVGKAGLDESGSPALRRAAAAAAARAALLAHVEQLIHMGETDPLHPLLTGTLYGAEIIDRWVASDGTEYAIAEMNRLSFRLALAQQPDVAQELKDQIEERLSPVFQYSQQVAGTAP